MVRLSVEYPARAMTTLCWPGASPGRLNGVTQLGSVRPSMRTSAPSGVELMVSCPGIATTATGAAFTFLCVYLGTTETAGDSWTALICSGAAGSGAGAGGCAVFHAGLGAGLDGTDAAGCSVEVSSAEFSEW